MKRYIIFLLRLVVGLVFLYAGVEKSMDLYGFKTIIENYQILPWYLVNITAIILPWIEIFLGIFLVLGILRRGTSFLSIVVLTLFTLAVISAVVRGIDTACGCFSTSPTSERVGIFKIAENSLLLFMALVIFKYYGRRK